MEKVFDKYSAYYDLLYKDKDYKAEAEYVTNLLGNSKSVLELGCGTGKHAKLLVNNGFSVYGIDSSETMLEQAKTIGIDCEIGDARSFRCNKIFGAIISLFHVMSYQNTDKDVLDEFNTASFHLQPGGKFIFDVWYKDAVLSQIPEKRVKKLKNDEIEVTRYCNPNHIKDKNIVEVNYDIEILHIETGLTENIKEKHSMRYFSKDEIVNFAVQSGFKITKVEEWLTKNNPSENTWGVCFVAEKL